MEIDADWERRLADAWASIADRSEAEFLALIDRLAAELSPDSGVAAFERAAAFDSTGHSDLAVPLYRRALDRGLTGERRRRAVIQMASSQRNLGRPRESVALLTAEMEAGSDHLDDAVRAFLALALTDVGREREAVSLAVGALARHLPRYQRSTANYARLLLERPVADNGAMRSDTHSITIDAPRDDVLAFVADGANLPRWAPNFASAIRPDGDGWIVGSGDAEIRLDIPVHRELGTVDLHITLPNGGRRAVYLRVLPNAGGAEVLFTAFHSDSRTDEDIARQNAEIEDELRLLKSLCESR